MRIKASQLFALAVLAIVCWLSASWLLGTQNTGRLAVCTVVPLLFVFALAWAALKMSAWVWICAGLLNLAGLSLPDSLIIRIFTAQVMQPLESLMEITRLLLPSIGLITAALLLGAGLNLWSDQSAPGVFENGDRRASRRPVGKAELIALVLAALVLLKSLHSFY